jgi:glycosyltransferase involved in cell wall biosynthesis
MLDIALFSPLGRGGMSGHGGITPVVSALGAALCGFGLEVALVTFAPKDPRELVSGLDPRLGVYNLGHGGRRRHLGLLRHFLRRERPRALLAAGHRANLLAAHCAGVGMPDGPRTRILLGVHNAPSPALAELGPLRRWARLRAMRRWYPRSDGVVCVSAGVAADLGDLVPLLAGRLRVIHNPVVMAEPDGPPAHPWLSDEGPPVILGAGRLTRQKAFTTLIRAFARLETRPAPRLVIIGEGSERDALLHLAAELGVAERVALPGFVANPRAQMARARLFALSSDWEGFGNVLVEAMSVGTPVVATDCPSGPREILRDGALGSLVPPGDPAALAAAIDAVLRAPPVAAEALRQRAADFAPTRVAERYRALLVGDAT